MGLCVSLCQVQAVESAFKVVELLIAHSLTNANTHTRTEESKNK